MKGTSHRVNQDLSVPLSKEATATVLQTDATGKHRLTVTLQNSRCRGDAVAPGDEADGRIK